MKQFIVDEGSDELAGHNPIKMNIANQVLKELIEKDLRLANKLYLRQGWLFYGGMIFYFLWHLYGMWVNTTSH